MLSSVLVSKFIEQRGDRWCVVAHDRSHTFGCHATRAEAEQQLRIIEQSGKAVAKYSPDQPRVPAGDPDGGQWAGGSGAATELSADEIDRVAWAQNIADQVKAEMKVDVPVDVVMSTPRQFDVGMMRFEEGGHFDPATGRVQVNARYGNEETLSDMLVHELTHAQFSAVMKAQAAEHKDLAELATKNTQEWDRLFKKNGYPRPEAEKEIKERWPASSLFAEYWHDAYLGPEEEKRYDWQEQKLYREDGDYSTAYWHVVKTDTDKQTVVFVRAINETLAESQRIAVTGRLRAGDKHPSTLWLYFGKDLAKTYQKVKGRRR